MQAYKGCDLDLSSPSTVSYTTTKSFTMKITAILPFIASAVALPTGCPVALPAANNSTVPAPGNTTAPAPGNTTAPAPGNTTTRGSMQELLVPSSALMELPNVRTRTAHISYTSTDLLDYAGTNSYWMPFLTSDEDVDTIMGHLAELNLKVLRVWGFNDVETVPGSGTVYFQSFSGSEATINTGANGLQRLDAVVKAAEKHDIKLIVNFVNYWTDYGGMKAYFKACGASSYEDWYKSSSCQDMYQAYTKAVVSRYTDSSSIFAWELANEPRCPGCETSAITNWVTANPSSSARSTEIT